MFLIKMARDSANLLRVLTIHYVFILAIVFCADCSAFDKDPVSIKIYSNKVSQHKSGELLGVHSLYWGHAEGLFVSGTQKTNPVVTELFKKTGGVIRFGGVANDVSWRVCDGDYRTRRPYKVVPWAGELVCQFGLAEYFDMLKDSGLETTWFIANTVGDSKKRWELTDAYLNEATQGAKVVAEKSGAKNRYWELGNELERGKFGLSPSEIAKNANLSAQAILRGDPGARLIQPLIEFDHPKQPVRKIFNTELLESLRFQVDGIALHTYYDGRSGGPPVSKTLSVVQETGELASIILKKPTEIWVTEHGRWPDGMPSDENWKANWYKTNDIDGVLATADYLIGLSQIPQVAGAMVHGVRAGPWNVFDIKGGVVSYTGIGKLLNLFSGSGNSYRLTTKVDKPGILSGIDASQFRVAAFQSEIDNEVSAWVVNRSKTKILLQFGLADDLGVCGHLTMRFLSCENGADYCREVFEQSTISQQPTCTVEVPARSISLINGINRPKGKNN